MAKSGAFIDHSVFTPQRFNALAPYLQTQALLLAVEFGNPPTVIAASIDLPLRRVAEIMRSRHGHALSLPDYEPFDEDDALPAPSAVPSLRNRVLRHLRRSMTTDGTTFSSTVEMAEALCVRTASVARSVRELVTAGHIVCVSAGSAHRAAQYRITEQGHRHLAEAAR